MQKGRFLDTPLHAAAQKDCPDIIRLLLEFGANINTRNLELQRPVETAPPSSTAESVLLLYEGIFSHFFFFFNLFIGFIKSRFKRKERGNGFRT